MPLVVFLALGSLSGLWAGLICAAWITGYAVYAIDDTSRVIQIAFGAVSVALIIGWQTRALRQALVEAQANRVKADIVDNFNGNVGLALGAIDILDSLRFGWAEIPDAVRYGMVERARGKIADQVTLARSFREMAADRGFVLGETDG